MYGALPGGGLDDKADLLAAILRAERYAPVATMMVGDRYHDIHAAKANGLRSVGVLWGYGGLVELQQAGADRIVATSEEIPPLVRALTV